MKTMQEILDSTPRKDKIMLKWEEGNEVHITKISEEQFRWIAVNIAYGNFPYDKVTVSFGKSTAHFDKLGRLTSPLKGCNALCYCDDLALGLFRAPLGANLTLGDKEIKL